MKQNLSKFNQSGIYIFAYIFSLAISNSFFFLLKFTSSAVFTFKYEFKQFCRFLSLVIAIYAICTAHILTVLLIARASCAFRICSLMLQMKVSVLKRVLVKMTIFFLLNRTKSFTSKSFKKYVFTVGIQHSHCWFWLKRRSNINFDQSPL